MIILFTVSYSFLSFNLEGQGIDIDEWFHHGYAMSVFDLIKEGEVNGVLDQETCDYLHTLRKQRNEFAHGGVDAKARLSRVLLVITAASLAWSKLNCKPC